MSELMGIPGLAYHHGVGVFGMNAAIVALGIPVSFWLIGWPAWRAAARMGAITPAELYAARLRSPALGIVLFVAFSIYTLPYLVISVLGVGLAVSIFTRDAIGLQASAAILVVTIGYTAAGGMRATMWTNVFQGTVFLGDVVHRAGAARRAAGRVGARRGDRRGARRQPLRHTEPRGRGRDMMPIVDRFAAAEAAFAAAHAGDPRVVDGTPHAARYHEHVARWVDALDPAAPEVVRLAARCQHIRRWLVPRSDFPEGRDGYKRWRSTLARRHAEDAAAILAAAGYAQADIARVGDLLTKKHLRSDPLVQLLEDAVCLTFIELEFADFAVKHPEAKVVEIVRKTWDKMSERGHAHARTLVERLAASPEAPPQLAWLARALPS